MNTKSFKRVFADGDKYTNFHSFGRPAVNIEPAIFFFFWIERKRNVWAKPTINLKPIYSLGVPRPLLGLPIFTYYDVTHLLFVFYQAVENGFASFHLYVCAAFLKQFSHDVMQEHDFQVCLFVFLLYIINYATQGGFNFRVSGWNPYVLTKCETKAV